MRVPCHCVWDRGEAGRARGEMRFHVPQGFERGALDYVNHASADESGAEGEVGGELGCDGAA